MQTLYCLFFVLLIGTFQAFAQSPVSRTQAEAKERVDLVHKRLMAGGAFAQLASQYSDDPASAVTGGGVNWIERDELNGELLEIAARLKVNEISQPFETRFGYHVVQLLERRGKAFRARHILVLFSE